MLPWLQSTIIRNNKFYGFAINYVYILFGIKFRGTNRRYQKQLQSTLHLKILSNSSVIFLLKIVPYGIIAHYHGDVITYMYLQSL